MSEQDSTQTIVTPEATPEEQTYSITVQVCKECFDFYTHIMKECPDFPVTDIVEGAFLDVLDELCEQNEETCDCDNCKQEECTATEDTDMTSRLIN